MKKKYVVEAWFKIEEVFDDEDRARRAAHSKKDHGLYRDVRIIQLEENPKKEIHL